MSTRPVVSYDDITLPYSAEEAEAAGNPFAGPSSGSHTPQQPPSKKRKWKNDHNHHNKRKPGNANHNVKHNAQGTPAAAVAIGPVLPVSTSSTKAGQGRLSGGTAQDAVMEETGDGEEAYYEEGEENWEEESRELTHDEIWDDSALVHAWEAAQEEYEMYHGINNKDWQTLPVKKSPLWYNTPVDPAAVTAKKTSQMDGRTDAKEQDSVPLNFDTFVPTHDPSLENASQVPAHGQQAAPVPMVDFTSFASQGNTVSQDEAFARATSAMYWAGYWTAMYQCQSQASKQASSSQNPAEKAVDHEEEEDEDDGDSVPDESGFVSTQR